MRCMLAKAGSCDSDGCDSGYTIASFLHFMYTDWNGVLRVLNIKGSRREIDPYAIASFRQFKYDIVGSEKFGK